MTVNNEETKEKTGIEDVNFLELGQPAPESTSQEEPTSEEDEKQKDTEEQTEESDQETSEEEKVKTRTGVEEPPETESNSEEDEVLGEEEESSEETEETSGEETEPSFFESVESQVGLNLDEEDYEGINLEDPTEEDVVDFIGRVSEKMGNQRFSSELEKHPEVKKFYEFRKNGGDPNQYIQTMYPQVDFDEVEIAEDNSEQHEAIVRHHLQEQGYEGEEIDETVEDFQNGGILQKQAQRSLKKLQAAQKQQKEQLLETQKKKAKKAQEKAEKKQKELKSIISESKELAGIPIPEADKEQFKEYMFNAVNEDGHSQALLDGQQLTDEQRMAISYMVMKNFNFEDLIDKAAETKNSRKVREAIKKQKEDKIKGSSKTKEASEGDVANLKSIF